MLRSFRFAFHLTAVLQKAPSPTRMSGFRPNKLTTNKLTTWGVCVVLLLLGLCCQAPLQQLYAQAAPLGQWKAYLSNRNPKAVAIRGADYFAITDGVLGQYNLNQDVYREYTRVEGLSGVRMTNLVYDPYTDWVYIAYNDGLLDRFRSPSRLTTIREIALSSVPNKGVNALHPSPEGLWVGGDFGLVRYDGEQQVVRESIFKIADNPEFTAVSDVVTFDQRIWVVLNTGVYSAPLNAINLADPTVWRSEGGRNGLLPGQPYELESTTNQLFAYQNGDLLVYESDALGWMPVFTGQEIVGLKGKPHGLLYVVGNAAVRYREAGETDTLFLSNTPLQVDADSSLDRVVIADFFLGMLGAGPGGIQLRGPLRVPSNNAHDLVLTPQELYNCYSGYQFVPTGIFNAAYWNREEDTWKEINQFNELQEVQPFVSGDINPNTNEAYLTSWNSGVYRFVGGELDSIFNGANTPMQSVLGNQDSSGILVSNAFYDARTGNWWFTQYDAPQNPLLLRTPAGNWYSYPAPSGAGTRYFNVMVDRNGYAWCSVRDNGIVVYDIAGTPGNVSDDRVRHLRTGAGRGDLPTNQVWELAEDENGVVWAGTGSGLVAFFNSFNIFDLTAPTDAVCPLFEGLCLLADESIQTIELDGGDRKWLGTTNGLYLFDADVSRQVAFFNTNNSPLISNNITDIEIDPRTGEVFLATSAGIVSYTASATEPAATGDSLYVFPNPIYTDYQGQIGIRGTGENARVIITDVTGHRVTELQATGGQAVWDGRDNSGNRPRTGVYIVSAYSEEGELTARAKCAIVER